MPVSMGVRLTGLDSVVRETNKVNPLAGSKIIPNSLRRIVFEVQSRAKDLIVKGGGPPKKDVLTWRTGTGGRSIGVDFSDLPQSAAVGTRIRYMALHELGGVINVKAHTRGPFQRSVAFGRRVKPFTVPQYSVNAYQATYPKRPYLKPAGESMIPTRAGNIMLEEVQAALAV